MKTKVAAASWRKILFTFSCFIVFALILTVGYLFKSRPKIAYVRTLEIVYGYNGMKQAHDEFKSQATSWQANIDTLNYRYRQSVEIYQQKARSLSAKEVRDEEVLLKRMESDLKNYSAVVQEESKRREKKLTEAVLNQINSFIEQYSKDRGYDIVFGAEGTGSVMYGSEVFDITDDVLIALNAGYKILPVDSIYAVK